MHPALTKIRFELSRWASVVAIALLVYCGLLLVTLWWNAAVDGMIPERWGDFEGNHGPWRGYYVGRWLVWNVMMMPFFAGVAALASLLIKPNFRAGLLLCICFVAFLIVGTAHYWLID
jgi:hypothetical protein